MATTPVANAYFPHLHELLESDETPDAPPYNSAFAQEAQLPAKVGRGREDGGRNSKAAALAEKEEGEENYISTGYMMPVRGPLKGPAALGQPVVERSLSPLPVPGGGTTPRRRTSSGVRKSKAPKERGRERRRPPPRTAATDHVISVEELGLRVDALLDRLAAADPESLSPRRGPLGAEDHAADTGDADWSSFDFEEGLLDNENLLDKLNDDEDDELRQYLDEDLHGRLNRQHDVFVRAFLEGSCSPEQSPGPFSSEERDAAWRQLEEVSADLGRQLEAEMQRKNDDDMEEMEKAERRHYGEEFGTSGWPCGSRSRSSSGFFSRAAAPTSPCSEALETLRRRLEGAVAEAAVIGGEQKREEASARAQSAEVPAPRGGTVLPDETGRRGPERDGSSLFRLPMAVLRVLGRKAPRSQQQAFAALVEVGKAVARRLRRHFELETEIDLAHECCVCLECAGADQLLVACSSADPVSHWIHAECLQGKGPISLDAEPISLDFSPQHDDRGTHPALESRTASSPDHNHPEDYAGAALQGDLEAAEVEDVSMIDAGEDGQEDQHEERSAEELQASVARWADVAERMSRVFRDELAELHEDVDEIAAEFLELQRDNVLWAYERTVAGYRRFQHWVSQLPVAQEVLVRRYLRLLLPMMVLHYMPSACADDSLGSLLTWGIVLLLVLAR
eukprot:g7292.t1